MSALVKMFAVGVAAVLLLLARSRLLQPIGVLLGGLDSLFDRLRTRRAGDSALAFFLLAPSLLILGAFGIAPLIAAIYMSLFDVRRGVVLSFVGLKNYWTALANPSISPTFGPSFWNSFFVTVYFAVGTIPTTMIFSFLVANCLFRIGRGRGLFRTLYFLPYVTSVVAAAMVWRIILNPDFGLANAVLGWVGLPRRDWLLESRSLLHFLAQGRVHVGPSLALCCVIVFEIWHSSGFMIVILLAGLTAIPRELEEAARIDGANWFQVTRKITIPLLSPTVFFLAIVSGIKSFQAFNSFYALTGGGPLNTTQNMTMYIYSSFYEYGKWGYGTAVATLLCLAIVTLTLLQWRFVGRKVHYE